MTQEVLQPSGVRSERAHAAFAGILILSVIAYWKVLRALATFSLTHESSSHILIIPCVSIYLLYSERSRIFEMARGAPASGSALMLAAVAGYLFFAKNASSQGPEHFLPGATLSIVLFWLGGFLLCYGLAAWRKASFPLLFLLLMVPLPQSVLDLTIYYLQRGSTEIAYLLFRLVGIPVLREGFILHVPHQSIEVAKECSGIRSSVALFITCLLAAHLFLRTKWKMLVFALLAFPLAVIKNGIRITTLTLLAAYVDPRFLTGSLHHDGGFVFFFLALAILAPILLALQKSEGEKLSRHSTVPLKIEGGLAPGQ